MVIETERLLLRPFLESDAADVFEYLAEPMVNCFACMKLDSLEEARTRGILFCCCIKKYRESHW